MVQDRLTVIDSPSRDFWKFLLQELLRLKKMMLKGKILLIYIIVGSLILIAIVTISYCIHGILNTGIMLGGWDTPFYAWHAKTVIQYGPCYLMQLQSYTNLYTQLLAFFGFISGSVVLAQRIFPIALGMLSILLFALISYRISNNVHVAGLTAILTSLTVGTLHLASEYHRNHMAYVLGLSAFLMVPKLGDTIINRRCILITLLLLTTAATQFETFALFSLSLILAAIIIKDWRRLKTLLFSCILASGIIFIIFPEFLGRYVLNVTPAAFMPGHHPVYLNYGLLVFWTIGSWILLPIALFGLFGLHRASRLEETRAVSLPVFVFSTLLILSSLVFIHIDRSDLNSLALRALLLLPVPIILALGIEQMINVVRRLSIRIELKGVRQRTLVTIRGKGRAGSIVAILLSVMMIVSLTYTSVEATKIIMVPFVRVSGYSKIVAVRQYLQNNNLEAPIFMFNGTSLWNSDLYRAYIGIEIGEHLAYFGDLENLIELRPTGFSYPSPAGEIANFTSVRYLEDMLGDKKYLIYPQKAFVRNVSDLRLHPLVYIVPELWDGPVPFYIKKFQVAEDIYVVPSLAEIEDKVSMEIEMMLETEKGVTTVKGKLIGNIVQVEIEADTTWFRLNHPPNLTFAKLEQGGALSYPECDPRRPDGSEAVTGNDCTESLQYWRVWESIPNATMVLDGAVRKEGGGSLCVSGTTDGWGNVFVVFQPPYSIDLSDYLTLSFWSMVNQKDVTWTLLLEDASGYRASYWDIVGGKIVLDSEVEKWKRLVVNLSQPNEKDPEFDFKKIAFIGIATFMGKADKNVTFYIDDITLDKQLKSNEIYKARILPNEKLVVYLSIKEEMDC